LARQYAGRGDLHHGSITADVAARPVWIRPDAPLGEPDQLGHLPKGYIERLIEESGAVGDVNVHHADPAPGRPENSSNIFVKSF
jgi:hypothetical protein